MVCMFANIESLKRGERVCVFKVGPITDTSGPNRTKICGYAKFGLRFYLDTDNPRIIRFIF